MVARHHQPLRHLPLFSHIASLLKANVVLVVAFLAACVTSVIVPPDIAYLGYFDFKTLTCLFCTLAIICALRNIRFFTVIAEKLVSLTGSIRRAILAILCITFIGSMLIANDMALITFLPLGYLVLSTTGQEKHMAFTFIMQNIAANLGGMLTPFGNPQNLFLYNKFTIPTGEFMSIMLLPFLVAIGLIVLSCFLFVKDQPITLQKKDGAHLPAKRTALYLVLFALSIVIVFRVIPYVIGLILIPAVLIVADRKALKQVDYGLLLTFVCFFIFAGNMSRIDAVNNLLSTLLNKNPLLVSALSCQVISNVPSAILLSEFTENYRELLLGVNIGGTGTLIASLASLITFRQYAAVDPSGTKRYLVAFSAFNFAFLAILLVVCSL